MSKIDWMKWSAVAEIVSSLAILVTLIYLAVQTGQNTAAIQASTRQTWLAEDRALLEVWIEHPEQRALWIKEAGSLTDEEKISLTSWLVIFIRNREIQWLQFQNGVIDEKTWSTYSSSIGPLLSFEVTRPWWEKRSLSGEWDAGFVAYVNEILSTTPVTRPSSISELTEIE